MARVPYDRPHLHLDGGGKSEPYTSPKLPLRGLPPTRARAEHAARLKSALDSAIARARVQIAAREPSIAEGPPGFYLEFDLPVDHQQAIDSLENKKKAIELVAVRPPEEGDEKVSATVFVPETAAAFFEKRVEEYRDKDNPVTGTPRHQNLIARLDDVRLAAARSLFTDDSAWFPAPEVPAWWEVWLRDGRLSEFESVAGKLHVTLKPHTISFPERDVVLAFCDEATMERLIQNSDAVAELRMAKDTPALFLEMRAVEEAEWAGDLADRITGPATDAPAVCLLDSGTTQSHPLIAPGLQSADQHAYDKSWGVGDSDYWNGHGTLMAGMALYADLFAALSRQEPINLKHCIESVKILPPQGQNDPELYGAITAKGIALAETRAPRRRRVVCMAVTSDVGLGRGRPSSWSAAVDQLCYGGGDRRRLVVLATGNLRGDINAAEYPERNDLEEVESPAQAWNPVVCGAFTEMVAIAHPDYFGWVPVAPAGDLSPASRTSTIWDRQWPIRPDVVFEGGNLAHDGVNPASAIDDLQLISTHYKPNVRLFDAFGDTSAATALGANLAANIMSARPELWPETVRGLIVHSAEWTEAMRSGLDAATSQTLKLSLLRRYGWGVPDLTRALLSAANDATLMVEDVLLPFRKDGSQIKTRDMNLHLLPWPKDELDV